MSTYPYCGDRQLEPPDDSEAELAFEQACDAAFDRYIADGWLPDGRDPSHVDQLMSKQIPEAMDQLMIARDDAALLEIAKRIRGTRIEIVEGLIKNSLPKARRAA
ncbi:hypothetical protein EQG41_18120 [Billgrantia azerbaijanica]|nr:hypothetical protein EQG41_18120 [Halomonas azerbaijanica]